MAKPKTEQLPAKPYEPTKREAVALGAFAERRKQNVPVPSMKVKSRGMISELTPDHPDTETGYRLIMESLGTGDTDFATAILDELAMLAIPGRTKNSDAYHINTGLALARGVRPEDEVEAMLATQMAAIHMATMTTAARLSKSTDAYQIELHEKALNKLARTFTTQIEALKRYRSKGEQKVTVEHVTVNEGGQAIVGLVSHRGGVEE
jgi:hypothetical protein